MEYITEAKVEDTAPKILCCQCGAVIDPNPANMCVSCLRTQVDITEGIPKQATLYFCKGCERYLQPPAEWITCALESRELLSLCLKKLKGLNRVKLVDAGFIWTEPHSKRIKVKLTVHGEVLGGTTLQQVFVVEYTVNNQMCDDCHRSEAQDYWRSLVQVRQKCENKKTFYYLEQLILKHKAHEHTLGIKPIHGAALPRFAIRKKEEKYPRIIRCGLHMEDIMYRRYKKTGDPSRKIEWEHIKEINKTELSRWRQKSCQDMFSKLRLGGQDKLCPLSEEVAEGLDFFYATEGHARKMVDFLTTVLPCRYQHSKKLISHDIHSNIYNYKFTYSVEIVPLSKDSVVCLPKKLTHRLGGISPICLIYRVTNSVHIIDPSTAQIAELSSTNFWRHPFNSICNPKQLAEYIVMDVDIIRDKDRKVFPGQGAISNKHTIADVLVVRASELGKTENTIHTRTHLGHILKPGDSVLGYTLADSNINDPNLEKLDATKIPDVILVKKYYGDRSSRRRLRNWKLKHLAEESTHINTEANDYHEFLDDLEEDPAYRQNVNIFRDPSKDIPVDVDDIEESAMPRITLGEMLDDLQIMDEEMADAS